MSNFYIKFSRPILLPKYEILTGISYDTRKIYVSTEDGDKLYIISNSGTVLQTQPLTTKINYLIFDNAFQNFYGYSNDNIDILSIYDPSFTDIGSVTLGYDASNFSNLQSLSYNLSSDSINLTYNKNINTVAPSGDILNNNFITKSRYLSSNISGGYQFLSVVNRKRNYLVKTDLAGNLLEYFNTPKNMQIISFSLISADEFKNTYYLLGRLNNVYYLLEACFANTAPSNPRTTTQTFSGENLTSRTVGYSNSNPFLYNPYTYPYGSSHPPGYATNLPNSPGYSQGLGGFGGFSGLGGFGGIGGFNGFGDSPRRNCSSIAAFSAMIYFLLCSQGDGDNCMDMQLMMAILFLIYYYQCKKKKDEPEENPCCPDPCDAAYYNNINELNMTNNFDVPYSYYYNNSNPIS